MKLHDLFHTLEADGSGMLHRLLTHFPHLIATETSLEGYTVTELEQLVAQALNTFLVPKIPLLSDATKAKVIAIEPALIDLGASIIADIAAKHTAAKAAAPAK